MDNYSKILIIKISKRNGGNNKTTSSNQLHISKYSWMLLHICYHSSLRITRLQTGHSTQIYNSGTIRVAPHLHIISRPSWIVFGKDKRRCSSSSASCRWGSLCGSYSKVIGHPSAYHLTGPDLDPGFSWNATSYGFQLPGTICQAIPTEK